MGSLISGSLFTIVEFLSCLIVLGGMHQDRAKKMVRPAIITILVILPVAILANIFDDAVGGTVMTLIGLVALCAFSYYRYDTSVKKIVAEALLIFAYICVVELILIICYGMLGPTPSVNLLLDMAVMVIILALSFATYIRHWLRRVYLVITGDRLIWITDTVFFSILAAALFEWKIKRFFGAKTGVFFLVCVLVVILAGSFLVVAIRKMNERKFIKERQEIDSSEPLLAGLAGLKNEALSGALYKAISANLRGDITISFLAEPDREHKIKVDYRVAYKIIRIMVYQVVRLCDKMGGVTIILESQKEKVALSFTATHQRELSINELMTLCDRPKGGRKNSLFRARRLINDNNGDLYIDYIRSDNPDQPGSIFFKVVI